MAKEISADEKLAKISLFHCCACKLAPKKEVGSQTNMLTTFHKLIFIRYFSPVGMPTAEGGLTLFVRRTIEWPLKYRSAV